MKKQKHLALALTVATLVLILGSCQQSGTSAPDIPHSPSTLPSGLVLGQGMLRGENPNLPELPPDEIGDTEVYFDYDNNVPGVKLKRTTYHTTGKSYNEYMVFNPAQTLVYPGNVFVGSTIATGEYRPVTGQKVIPVTLVNDLIPDQGGQLFSRTVPQIKWSSYEDVRKDWLQSPIKEPAATTEFEFTQVDLDKSGAFSVGASIGNGSWKLSGELSHAWKRTKTHVLIRMVQKLYTISMDRPEQQILENAGAVNLEGVVPVYVSDVYYGRIAYALVSSNYSQTDVIAALGLLIPSWSNLDVTIKSEYHKILNEAYLHQLSIGGPSQQQSSFAEDGWEGFRKSLAQPIPTSSAAPISFTLKYVDDNSVASLYLTDRFPVVESHFIPESKSLTFHFRPMQLKGKAIGKKDIYLYGTTTVTLPNGQVLNIFDATQDNYYRMTDSDVFTNIEAPTVPVTITRPAHMSMADFMEQEIIVNTHLYNTNATGAIKGDDLGQTVVKRKLKDLIFDANQHNIEITTQRNHPGEYTGAIFFQLEYEVNR